MVLSEKSGEFGPFVVYRALDTVWVGHELVPEFLHLDLLGLSLPFTIIKIAFVLHFQAIVCEVSTCLVNILKIVVILFVEVIIIIVIFVDAIIIVF